MDDRCQHVIEDLFSGQWTLCTCLHLEKALAAGEALLDLAVQFQHQYRRR